ncbi:MAG: ice-binding family protein [Melioribacteraceae bacterium]|nr:ice-binding family protein [Melioribacteraceae bacterium]
MNIDTFNSTSVLRRCLRFIVLMLVVILMLSSVAYSQPYNNPAPVPLLTAGTYGALASTGITGSANITGDVGTVTGTIDGTIIPSGTNWGMGNSHTSQAQTDLAAALSNAFNRTNDDETLGATLGGKTLTRGVYAGGALDLASGTILTLNGSATDVFIIKAASTLTINTNSTVSLTGGAVWSNVFWYVGSSATINGGSSTFNGIILAVVSISLTTGSTVTAKLLANTGTVTINSDVLPVELTSFTAELKNNSVELYWTTATEINNYGFNVELKIENGELNKIGFVQGHGNSNSPKEYSFTDSPFGGTKFKYRLKQIDFDGAYEYSDEIEVNLNPPSKLTLVQNYPNPFNPTTIISFEIPVKSNVVIKVYNVIGSEIADLLNEEKLPGRHQVEFNASYLPSGIYFYSINAGELKPIMKKMILLK